MQDKAKWNEYCRNWRYKKKEELIDFLGGKCARCGLDDRRILQIDHKDGSGALEIRRAKRTWSRYLKLLKEDPNSFKERFQLLCPNCNWIKRIENNEHRRLT